MQFDTSTFETITSKTSLERWVRKLEQQRSFAFDTETTGLDIFEDELVGIAISYHDKGNVPSCYIPLAHKARSKAKQLPIPYVLDALRPVLADKRIGKIFHNAEYDLNLLAQKRYSVEINNIHDTKVMGYTLTAGEEPLDMDFMAMRYLKWKTIQFKDVVANRPGRADFRDVPIDEATQYAAEDTAITLILAHGLMQALEGTGRLFEVYTRDRALIPVLVHMKQAGVRVDKDHLWSLEVPWSKDVDELRQRMIAAAGVEFNPNSPKQVLEVLEARGLDFMLNREGKKSTDKKALERHIGDAVVDRLLEYKGKAKLLSTYVKALPGKIKPHSGRIHGNFNFCGPITGRGSSSDPNLQNIPTRTSDGEQLRRAFVAGKGNRLITVDYSQIEYRVLAHITQSKYLMHCFLNGIDLHAKMAADVRGGTWQDYSGDEYKKRGEKIPRRLAKIRGAFKNVNFAVIYGASPALVAYMSEIEMGEAFEILEAHKELAPEVYEWKEAVWEQARKDLFVETLFGRRIPLPGINSNRYGVRGHAERLAINAPIQGSSADLMRMAMSKVHAHLPPKVRMLLTVHDELVIEAPQKIEQKIASLVKYHMETAADHLVKWTVPIIAEAGAGTNWKEAKDA